MNAIAIYDEINLITEYDIKIFEEILDKQNLLCPYHIYKNKVCHYLSLMLFLFLENTKRNRTSFLGNLRYDKMGVPRLGILYHSSYCAEAVCCAVVNVDIGIDIQNNIDIRFEEIEKYMSEKEMGYLRKSTEWKKQAIRLFTLKESFGKYYQFGLHYPLKNVTLWNSNEVFFQYGLKFSSYYFDNYIMSVCSPKNLTFNLQMIHYKELIDMANILLCMNSKM